mgnify:CR=1 FL=1
MDYTPDHLRSITTKIESIKGFDENNWFCGLSCKLKLNHKEGNLFKIITNGIKFDDGSIIGKDDCPLKIFAQDISDKKLVNLFDEEIHGYTPLLIERKEYNYIDDNEFVYTDDAGNDSFEVYIWANSSVDFEDEFQFDKDNKTELLNGESVDIDFLKRNAFDAFGIILKNQNNEYIILAEIELS